MRLLFVSACLAVLATASTAQAQECDRNNDSQQMMTICAGEDYQAADAKLNQAYQALVDRNGAKANKLLQAAQRAWIAFRDAECAYTTADSMDGSIHPMEVSQCLTGLTNERITQLTTVKLRERRRQLRHSRRWRGFKRRGAVKYLFRRNSQGKASRAFPGKTAAHFSWNRFSCDG